jgi:hypothetical protein
MQKNVVFFQQDNTAAHTADKSVSTALEVYENRIRSKDWPPRYPHFRYDYDIWRYLKGSIQE